MSSRRGYARGVNLWLDGFLAAGTLMAAVARDAPLDAKVPTCPDWVLRDLLRHTGGVHRWAMTILQQELTEFPDVELVELAGGWPPDSQLAAWFMQGVDELYDTLSDTVPELQCATFLDASTPSDMWMRRQCHETVIHRVDVELTVGLPVTPILPMLACDGIDELVRCFITRPGGRLRSSSAVRRLGIHPTDYDDGWLLRIGADGVTTRRTSGPADCTISGTAHDLYVTLWSRADPGVLHVQGDRSVFETFLDKVHVRWA